MRQRTRSGRWVGAKLLLWSWIAGMLLLVGCSGERRPPNVLVLVIDTLRADHLGCYGAERETSPHIDGLAAQGVLFEDAVSAAPRTWQSFTTILTGRFPLHHGVRFEYDQPLAAEIESMGSLLGKAGYETAAFDVRPFLRGMTGGRGFQTYVDSQKRGRVLSDSEVADELLAWIAGDGPGPFLAFVRFRGPHWPYRAEKRFLEAFGSCEGIDHSFNEGSYGLTPGAAGQGFRLVDPEAYRKRIFSPAYPPEIREHMIVHYDASVRNGDEIVGRVLATLRESDVLDDTLVVVLADHGESFGEHGYFQHGPRVDGAVMHVPLVIRFPSAHPHGRPGQRIAQLVRTVDVLPTVLDVLGLPAPAGLDGTSLLAAVDRGVDLALTAYAETGREFMGIDPERSLPGVRGKQRMLRTKRWKIVYRHDGSAPIHRLYDLEADPAETRDVSAEHPRELAEMRASLEALVATDVNPTQGDAPLTEQQLEALRELGYVQ